MHNYYKTTAKLKKNKKKTKQSLHSHSCKLMLDRTNIPSAVTAFLNSTLRLTHSGLHTCWDLHVRVDLCMLGLPEQMSEVYLIKSVFISYMQTSESSSYCYWQQISPVRCHQYRNKKTDSITDSTAEQEGFRHNSSVVDTQVHSGLHRNLCTHRPTVFSRLFSHASLQVPLDGRGS